MTTYEISVIIPTRNRRDDLLDCLSALADQTILPREIIIVDDGDLGDKPLSKVQKRVPDSVSLQITESEGEPGTSTARNTGAKAASCPIVLIVDDDTVLGPTYIERLQRLYNKYDDDNLAGIGGFDDSLRSPGALEWLYDTVFFQPRTGWCVNKFGFHSWESTISTAAYADWLSGNNASYKREVLLSYPFPHWSGGREALEDIGMGMQLSQSGYYCMIDPNLPVRHCESKDNETAFNFGVKRARNRVRIFRHFGKSAPILLFVWALIGDIIRQFLAPAYDGMVKRHWTIGTGMIIGAVDQLIRGDQNSRL